MTSSSWKVCVTGGSGFVGRHVCTALLACKWITAVHVLDLVPPRNELVKFVEGSVCDATRCSEAIKGVDAVIHCAGIDIGSLQPTEMAVHLNLDGTKTVLNACRSCGVKTILFISSTDVIDRWGEQENIPSNAPYPKSSMELRGTDIAWSKCLAEEAILLASNKLMTTCSIRLKGVYGEGDELLVGRFIDFSRAHGWFWSGIEQSSRAKGDFMYVGNVAHACVCALRQMKSAHDEGYTAKISGLALNISHESPCNLFDKMKPFLDQCKLQGPLPEEGSVFSKVRASVSMFLSTLPVAQKKLPIDPLFASKAGRDWISCTKTFRDPSALEKLEFTPVVTVEEAACRTMQWLRDRQQSPQLDHGRASRSIFVSFLFTVLLATIFRATLMYQFGY